MAEPHPPLNSGHTVRRRVGRGGPVLEHLLARFQHADAPTWRARIAAGEVRVDGEECSPDTLLVPGQELSWVRPPWVEPAAPLRFDVVYEDEHLLAVSKPSGLPTLPGSGYSEHTLLHQVRLRSPGASPMHRLGRGTSGLVLFTCTSEAARSVQAQWRSPGAVRKLYRALVQGEPAWEELEVDQPIGLAPDPVVERLWCAAPGKPSLSHLRVLRRRGDASLLEVLIHTGRPHQIRIHTAWAGHPLAGDPLYGPGGVRARASEARPGDVGYLLHAHRLALRHPVSSEALQLEAPPPEALT